MYFRITTQVADTHANFQFHPFDVRREDTDFAVDTCNIRITDIAPLNTHRHWGTGTTAIVLNRQRRNQPNPHHHWPEPGTQYQLQVRAINATGPDL